MLTREQAREQLKQFHGKDALRLRLARLSRLPAEVADAGRALLGRDRTGEQVEYWSEPFQKALQAAHRLLDTRPRDRQRIFAALFPPLAAALEATWQLFPRLSYHAYWWQEPFRAPAHPQLANPRRREWLGSLLRALQDYDGEGLNAEWLATWAPYLEEYSIADLSGYLLAAVLDEKSPESDRVFEVLRESAAGRHETGTMGQHIPRALLLSSRPEGWELMEKMLLAAQRQEGLRQAILGAVANSHPQAFRRMLRLIVDHRLSRFSSVIRALNGWLGLRWRDETPRAVNQRLEDLLRCLTDPAFVREQLSQGDAEAVYFALWALAFDDVDTALGPAGELLRDASVERRFAAVTLLGQLSFPGATPLLLRALDDTDLRVATTALIRLPWNATTIEPERWELIQRLMARQPVKWTKLEPLVWPWVRLHTRRAWVADYLPSCLAGRPPTALLPFLGQMTSRGRVHVVSLLAGQKHWDAETRQGLFGLVADPRSGAGEAAPKALEKCKCSPEEIQQLEAGLGRAAATFRSGVLALLACQKDADALASVDRLLQAPTRNQRLGGVELMWLLVQANRLRAPCRQRAEAYRAGRRALAEGEQELVALIIDPDRKGPTLDDALGLMDPKARTPITPPRKRKVLFFTPAARACLRSLDDLVHHHQGTSVRVERDGQVEEMPFGSTSNSYPVQPCSRKEVRKYLPLLEVWEKWLLERPARQRDRDGLELLRAEMLASIDTWDWERHKEDRRSEGMAKLVETILGEPDLSELRDRRRVASILSWLFQLYPPQADADYFLDALETAYALVPAEELSRASSTSRYHSGDDIGVSGGWNELPVIQAWDKELRWGTTFKVVRPFYLGSIR